MAATFLEGFCLGGIALEMARYALTEIRTRMGEKQTNQRKFAQDDLKSLGESISPIFSIAVKYYGSPSDEVVNESRQLAIELKSFAVKWKTVNKSLEEYGRGAMSDHLLISFRKSATFTLGERREAGLPLDSGLVRDLQKSTENLSIAITKARYDLA